MNGTGDTVNAETAAQRRFSGIAQWVMVGASLIHDACARYVTEQTRELAGQLAALRAGLADDLTVAYAAGRSAERGELVRMEDPDAVLAAMAGYAQEVLDRDEREHQDEGNAPEADDAPAAAGDRASADGYPDRGAAEMAM